MENTLENKTAFIAQYWGQPVLTLGTNKNYPILNTWISCLMADSKTNGDYFQGLELKPLSLITDEDALMCYKIHFKDYLNKDIRPDESRITFAKKHIIHPIEVCILEVTDYLRSKGYAIPYMDLSVDKQIEYGWVKLTTHA